MSGIKSRINQPFMTSLSSTWYTHGELQLRFAFPQCRECIISATGVILNFSLIQSDGHSSIQPGSRKSQNSFHFLGPDETTRPDRRDAQALEHSVFVTS
jgi:hypothetical protein